MQRAADRSRAPAAVVLDVYRLREFLHVPSCRPARRRRHRDVRPTRSLGPRAQAPAQVSTPAQVDVRSVVSGAPRSVAPLAGPHQRARLFAAVYLVGYLSFGVPVILAGLLITPLGLTTTGARYGTVIVITAAAGPLCSRAAV